MNIQAVSTPAPLRESQQQPSPERVISSVLIGRLSADDARLGWLIVMRVGH